MNGVIQSDMAVLSFDKNGFTPYLCCTDASIILSPDIISTRTPGAGHWGKNAYQKINWSVNISGVTILNQISDASFTSMDIMDNILGFVAVLLRLAFVDEQGNIKTAQGLGIVSGLTWSKSSGAVVKDNITIVGDGELKFFDGLIPCDSEILTITVTGQTAADGIVHIAYTYTGAPYQVKYRIDGTGNYIYALIDAAIDIPSLALGAHSVEIIPVCANGYEGDGLTQSFEVTQSLTCVSAITNITITPTTATPVYSGAAIAYFYVIDGGFPGYIPSITSPVPLGGLSVGPHTILMTPVCANGITGTGFTKSFTVASQPAQSIINWQRISAPTSASFYIYVNGILTVVENSAGTTSGSLTVATGATVKGAIAGGSGNATLQTTDSTITSVLDNRSGVMPAAIEFSFIANGDTYFIAATITP